MRETKAGRKTVSEGESRRLSRKKSAGVSCFRKEIRLLVRSPIYFMNCVMMVFLWPLFLIIPFSIQIFQNQDIPIGELLGMFSIEGTGGAAVTMFVVLCISLGVGLFNYAAGTAISREGKNLYFMKIIPVPLGVQLRAKLLTAVCFGMAGTTLYCMIFLVAAVFLFGLPVWTLPFALVGSICANVIQCTLQLFVDLFHPKLSWESEQQAVKQNFTVILGVLLNMAAGVALGILVFLFYDLLSLPLPVYAGAVCLVLAAVAFLLYKLVLAYGVKRIADYE